MLKRPARTVASASTRLPSTSWSAASLVGSWRWAAWRWRSRANTARPNGKELQPLDDRDVGGAAALAHRLQTVAAAGALQRMQHRREQLCARGTQRMAERDRAAAGVDFRVVDLELLHPRH